MMISRSLLTVLLTVLSAPFVYPQVSLPYSTGFDSSAEKEGWEMFSYPGASPDPPQTWIFTDAASAYSAPGCLYHGYPVGGTMRTDNWFVSPGFDIPDGGTLDSIYHSFSGFGHPGPGDTVALYLLIGHKDPSLSDGKILLKDFRGDGYMNDGVWSGTFDIDLPAQSSICYFAIRYTTTVNWLDVKFDNIGIGTKTSASVAYEDNPFNIHLYPNPADGSTLHVHSDHRFDKIHIFNALGRVVYEDTWSEQIDVSLLVPGVYYLYMTDQSAGVSYHIKFVKK